MAMLPFVHFSYYPKDTFLKKYPLDNFIDKYVRLQ